MHARFRFLIVALFTFVVPRAASAQQVQASEPAPAGRAAPAAQVAGPVIDGTATAFRQQATAQASDSSAEALQQRQSMGKPVALMIVGGAAILVGAVIGDAPGTLFMIGGAIALLYGLYKYLQ